MDYEKKYNEALERAKDFKNGIVQFALDPGESIVHYIFPELRESEDERIRKALILHLQSFYSNEVVAPGISKEMAIAWLEKQKEQKQTDFPAGFYVTMPDGKKYYTKEMRCNGMNVKVVEPKPAEWSEEEIEEMVAKRSRSTGTTKSEMGFYRNGIKDAIKRFGLRPSWKPSKEQIKALESCFCEFGEGCPDEDGLRSLYNDLKKLI